MTTKWTAFPPSQPAVSGDVLVGLLGGTTNQRFDAASWLFTANNLDDVASVTTAFNNISPLTTLGDTIYFDGANNVRLVAGTDGQIATIASGIPAWINNPALLAANNLSDLESIPAAITHLGVALITGGGLHSAIGGNGSTAAGQYAFAYGNTCSAVGNYSFAHGNAATATHNGAVVWGDSNATPNADTAADQFNLTFANGYRLFGGSVNVLTVGKGLAVKEGSNAKQGVVTLIAGVGVVANSAVTASSRIFYCGQDTNVTGFLTITARTTSSGFTITSSNSADTGVVAYEIFEPAA